MEIGLVVFGLCRAQIKKTDKQTNKQTNKQKNVQNRLHTPPKKNFFWWRKRDYANSYCSYYTYCILIFETSEKLILIHNE